MRVSLHGSLEIGIPSNLLHLKTKIFPKRFYIKSIQEEVRISAA
jgi:hypothetical protein